MRNRVAMSLAGSYARGKAADLALMALAVALAVFVSASAAGAASAFSAEQRLMEADPSYLEIRALPSALSQDRSDAVEALDAGSVAGFMMPLAGAEEAMAESPSVRLSYSYDIRVVSVGEASAAAFEGPGGELRAAIATRIQSAAGSAPADGSSPSASTQAPASGDTTGAAPAGFPEGLAGPGGALPPEFAQVRVATPEELAEAASLEKPLVESIRGALVDPAFFTAYGFKAAAGSLFTEDEAASGRSLMVLGSDLAGRLYADGQALGRKIRLDGITYEIVGVLEPTAYTATRDWNAMAFAPARDLRTAAGGGAIRFRPTDLVFAATSADRVDDAVSELSAYFDRTAGEGAIAVTSRKAELDERRAAQATLFSAAFALSGLCVLVAVLNLMNAAATKALKRRRSLGILRAIGATSMDVTAAAFWETAVSAGIGLVAGAALAIAFASATRSVLVPYSTAESMGLGGMLAAALGAAILPLALGTLPSWSAMRASPADLVRPD